MGFWNTMLKKIVVAIGILIAITDINAQIATSPLTQVGLGDKVSPALPAQFGMGGIGISNGDVRYLNLINPALLVENSVYTFSANVIGSSVTLSDGNNIHRNSDASFNGLAMSFPMKVGKWTTAISLKPYSRVAYQFVNQQEIIGTTDETVTSQLEGSGGTNQFVLSNGIRVTPNLYVGINAAYLFGSVIREQSTSAPSNPSVTAFYNVASVSKESMTGFTFGGGAVYKIKLKERLRLNIGATYDLQTEADIEKVESWQTRLTTDVAVTADTLGGEVIKSSSKLPSAYGIGFSLSNTRKWTAGIDIKYEDWSNFSYFESAQTELANSLLIAAGGEFTPDAGDINNYLSRVTYRLGVSYEDTPYVINNNTVQDFGINFGFSLPVSTISSLDMGFKYGNRGNIGKIGHKEEYFKFQLGLTFNDRLWFIKRKFD